MDRCHWSRPIGKAGAEPTVAKLDECLEPRPVSHVYRTVARVISGIGSADQASAAMLEHPLKLIPNVVGQNAVALPPSIPTGQSQSTTMARPSVRDKLKWIGLFGR